MKKLLIIFVILMLFNLYIWLLFSYLLIPPPAKSEWKEIKDDKYIPKHLDDFNYDGDDSDSLKNKEEYNNGKG